MTNSDYFVNRNMNWHTAPSGQPRARALGIPFPGEPGNDNSITDVTGVAVGYSTLISGTGALKSGSGPVRTGVTAILPRLNSASPCFAGTSSFNGNGEMTGTLWLEETGLLHTPITITNTHSCGTARDATLKWMMAKKYASMDAWGLPVAAETYDGELNDINGFHVKDEHVFAALNSATTGAIDIGSVGGGTGMCSYEFKSGSSTSSRIVQLGDQRYTVGGFVQSNFGLRDELVIAGVPIGKQLTGGEFRSTGSGSIIAIIATDAPLMPHQLKRLARRVPIGLARTGTIGHHSSGDIFLAFSTANQSGLCQQPSTVRQIEHVDDGSLDPLFHAVAQVVEEAVIDSMVVNETMVGANDLEVRCLPVSPMLDLLRHQGVLIS